MIFIPAFALPGSPFHGCADDWGNRLPVVHGSHIDRQIFAEITGHHGPTLCGRQQTLIAGQHLASRFLSVNDALLRGKNRPIARSSIHPGHGALVKNCFFFRFGQHKFQLHPGITISFFNIPGFHIDVEIVCHRIKGTDNFVFRCSVIAPVLRLVKWRSPCDHTGDTDIVHIGLIRSHHPIFLQRDAAQKPFQEHQIVCLHHILLQLLPQGRICLPGFRNLFHQDDHICGIGILVFQFRRLLHNFFF